MPSLLAPRPLQIYSHATTIAAATTTAGQFSTFENGGNAYIFYDQDGSASFSNGDGLIQLTGVKVADLTASNFLHA